MKNQINEFYEYLENRNYSNNTIDSYKKDLSKFLLYIKGKDLNSIDYNYIRGYLEYLYSFKYNNRDFIFLISIFLSAF